jgi:hypothetical protein
MRDAHRFAAVLPLVFVAALPALAASSAQRSKAPEAAKACEPFDVARVYLELNDTDGDLGLHGVVDGEDWESLRILDAGGKQSLVVTAKGALRQHGLTELSFESAEPTFDEVPPEEILARFPAGEWTVLARTVDNECLRSEVALRHVLPAPPGNVLLNGEPAAESCDSDPLPTVSAPVVISWDPVTTSHPEIGEEGPVEIVRYELVVEREEPSLLVLSVGLPPDVTSFTIPEDFTALGEELKLEILAIEAGGNRTAVESCFTVE